MKRSCAGFAMKCDLAEEFAPFFFTMGTECDEAMIVDYVAAAGHPVSRFCRVINMRSLVFVTRALGNFVGNPDASMNMFRWLTVGRSHPMMSRVNALISRVEEVRAQYVPF